MNIHRIVSAAVCWVIASCPLAKAEEKPVPSFNSKPARYLSRYGGELLLGDRTSKQLGFWFHLTGANNHACSMAGVAYAEDKEHYAHMDGECKLTLISVGGAIVLTDQNSQCRKLHCGARADIDGTVLFRKDAR